MTWAIGKRVTHMALPIIAIATLSGCQTKAQSEAAKFKQMDSAGASKPELCLQARRTAVEFDRQGDLIKFNEWQETATARCRGLKIKGPLAF